MVADPAGYYQYFEECLEMKRGKRKGEKEKRKKKKERKKKKRKKKKRKKNKNSKGNEKRKAGEESTKQTSHYYFSFNFS